jgi:hypothetical protein
MQLHTSRTSLLRMLVLAIAACCLVLGTGPTPVLASAAQHSARHRGAANAVIAWNSNTADVALASCLAPGNHPPFEARMYAIQALAVHDALGAIHPTSEPYAFYGRARGANPDAAVAAASHDTLVAVLATIPAPLTADCIDAGTDLVEQQYADALAAIPDSTSKTRGVEVGQEAAAAVLALRADDGSDTVMVDPSYPEGTKPGEWRFTPGSPFAFAPHWGDVTPFALERNDQFLPPPPYALDSAAYAADVNEIQRLGGDGVTTPSDRTPYQTQTALFWFESSPLQWNRIARALATSHRLDVWDAARLFGVLDAAMADGYIASFHTKFDVYRYWRPVTAIRLADTDGNPATTADPTWTPLMSTPPIPDYESAHTVEGAAAAAVMVRFFATDDLPFQACSYTLSADESCKGGQPVWRSYHSPVQAAHENGLSRILVGIHFRHAVDAGYEHGSRIGRYAFQTILQPLR